MYVPGLEQIHLVLPRGYLDLTFLHHCTECYASFPFLFPRLFGTLYDLPTFTNKRVSLEVR